MKIDSVGLREIVFLFIVELFYSIAAGMFFLYLGISYFCFALVGRLAGG